MRSRVALCSLFVMGALPSFADVKTTPDGALSDPPSICNAVSGNLVLNCGFETGTDADWVFTPAVIGTSFMILPGAPYANSGEYGSTFGAIGPFDDTLSQTLSDPAGYSYNLSFYLFNDSTAPGQADFHAYWDGVDIFNASSDAFPYTQFTFTVVGTGNDTLTFAGRQVPSFYALDDIVVTKGPLVTPEPGYIALLAAGLLVCLVFARGAQKIEPAS
jgi:hypothetical protein